MKQGVLILNLCIQFILKVLLYSFEITFILIIMLTGYVGAISGVVEITRAGYITFVLIGLILFRYPSYNLYKILKQDLKAKISNLESKKGDIHNNANNKHEIRNK